MSPGGSLLPLGGNRCTVGGRVGSLSAITHLLKLTYYLRVNTKFRFKSPVRQIFVEATLDNAIFLFCCGCIPLSLK